MTRTPKFEDNVAFVKRIMTYGSPLRQAFIIEAISKYAAACAKAPAETFETMWLNGEAWKEVAVAIDQECEVRYGNMPSTPAQPHPPSNVHTIVATSRGDDEFLDNLTMLNEEDDGSRPGGDEEYENGENLYNTDSIRQSIEEDRK